MGVSSRPVQVAVSQNPVAIAVADRVPRVMRFWGVYLPINASVGFCEDTRDKRLVRNKKQYLFLALNLECNSFLASEYMKFAAILRFGGPPETGCVVKVHREVANCLVFHENISRP